MLSPAPALAIQTASCRDARLLHRFSHEAMACLWELFIVGEEAQYAQQVAETAFVEVDRLERELSRFIPSSDVFRINALNPGESLRVGLATLHCLQLATEVHEQTGGAFDVTIGSLLDERRDESGLIQAPADVAALSRVGMEWLEINAAEFEVGWREQCASIDLGGIGKGYALDCIADVLRDWRVEAALVHSGQSTVLALGMPDNEEAWSVTLRDPRDSAQILGEIYLHDRALSGSGMLLHGQHIIDPRTGQAAQGKLATWAIAGSAARSDALSTAFMVMSPEEVEQYCHDHPGIIGLLLAGDPDQPTLMSFGALARL